MRERHAGTFPGSPRPNSFPAWRFLCYPQFFHHEIIMNINNLPTEKFDLEHFFFARLALWLHPSFTDAGILRIKRRTRRPLRCGGGIGSGRQNLKPVTKSHRSEGRKP
jgi:hypothetical protein